MMDILKVVDVESPITQSIHQFLKKLHWLISDPVPFHIHAPPRFIYDEPKFMDSILAEREWVTGGGLSSQKLRNIDPLLRAAWGSEWPVMAWSMPASAH